MNYKKILAVSLAGAMAFGNSMFAMAADKEAGASGSGEVQYVTKGDVFDVVLPTVADDATTFNYLLDPDGLIEATGGDRYQNKVFDKDKNVYFLRSEQVDGQIDDGNGSNTTGKVDYTDTSDEIEVVNKSTQAVNLTLKVKVEDIDGIKMATSTTFGTESPELYLAVKGKLTDDASATDTAISTESKEIPISIPADDAAYEIVWNATDKQYEKALTTEAKENDYAGFKSYTFQLTGSCNTHAGWAALKDKAPKVDLIWSVKDFTVTGPQISLNAQGLITVTNLTADKNYESITVTVAGEEFNIAAADTTWFADNWSAETGGEFTVQMGSGWFAHIAANGQKAKVKLNYTGGSVESAEVDFSASAEN
ncbi:MAG: hypothetical protein HFG50_05245 [Lachnospiraceae bacterium]|nr:hypothetical protein [Lachnospiraceae bacterium]